MSRERPLSPIPEDLMQMLEYAPAKFEGLVRKDPSALAQYESPESPIYNIHLTARDVFTHAVVAPRGFDKEWLHEFFGHFIDFGRSQRGDHTYERHWDTKYFLGQLNKHLHDVKEVGLMYPHDNGTVVISLGLPRISWKDWRDIVSVRKWNESFYIVTKSAAEIFEFLGLSENTPGKVIEDKFVTREFDNDPWIANLRTFVKANEFGIPMDVESTIGFTGRVTRSVEAQLSPQLRQLMHESPSLYAYFIGDDFFKTEIKKAEDHMPYQLENLPEFQMYDKYMAVTNWDERKKRRVSMALGNGWFHSEVIFIKPHSNETVRIRYEIHLESDGSLHAEKILAPMYPSQINTFFTDPTRLSSSAASTSNTRFRITETDVYNLQAHLDNLVVPLTHENTKAQAYLTDANQLLELVLESINS